MAVAGLVVRLNDYALITIRFKFSDCFCDRNLFYGFFINQFRIMMLSILMMKLIFGSFLIYTPEFYFYCLCIITEMCNFLNILLDFLSCEKSVICNLIYFLITCVQLLFYFPIFIIIV